MSDYALEIEQKKNEEMSQGYEESLCTVCGKIREENYQDVSKCKFCFRKDIKVGGFSNLKVPQRIEDAYLDSKQNPLEDNKN